MRDWCSSSSQRHRPFLGERNLAQKYARVTELPARDRTTFRWLRAIPLYGGMGDVLKYIFYNNDHLDYVFQARPNVFKVRVRL